MNDLGCLISSVLILIAVAAVDLAGASENQIIIIFIAIGVMFFVLLALLGNPLNEKQVRKRVKRVASADQLDGYQYEQFCASYLRHKGWTQVMVTSKSADYGADIVATDPAGTKYAIQCKKYNRPIGISAVQQVVGAKAYYGCGKGAVISYSGFTDAAKKLSQANGVELYTLQSYSFVE